MEKTEKTVGDFTIREVAACKEYCKQHCWKIDFGGLDELQEMEIECKKENPIGYAVCGVDVSMLIGDDKPEDVLNRKLGDKNE